jgi:glucokinase
LLLKTSMLALAIDLGGTHSTCALVRDTEVLSKQTVESSGSHKLAPMLPRFAAVLRDITGQHGAFTQDCTGLALGFCGLADFNSGRVLSTNQKYEDAPELNLSSWSRAELGVRFCIENDARMALLGERSAGAARGYGDIVMITLGTGIGGAVMMGGKLLRGRHNQAGCLGGHLAINPHGRRCTCGAIGCAESEASTWALPMICAGWPGFPSSRLAQEETLNFGALFRVADAGDTVANEIKQHCIDVWAALAVSLVHAYDPEVVVIGGGVMGSGDQILQAIRQRVQQTAWTPWGKVQVEVAQCGDNAALLGAIPLLGEVRQ